VRCHPCLVCQPPTPPTPTPLIPVPHVMGSIERAMTRK
jgi:hypothetical protein